MAASDKDFKNLAESNVYLSDQWPLIVRSVQSLLTVFREKIVTGSEPEDYLLGWYFSNGSDNRKFIRVQYNSGTSEFLVSKNTATEAAPSWTDMFKIDIATIAVTIPGNLTVTGTLTGGNHASRHLPNGADALTTGAPSDIGSSNTAGTANAFSRQDHVHRGVTSVDTDSSGAPLYGAVNFTSSGLADVSKSGQTVTVNAQVSNTIRVTNNTGVDQTITTTTALNNMSNLSLTGADGSKRFSLSLNVAVRNAGSAARTITINVHKGAAGTTGDTVIYQLNRTVTNALDDFFCIANLEITPSASEKITISAAQSSENLTVYGGATASKYASLTVQYQGN